jgi:hypothetical protein
MSIDNVTPIRPTDGPQPPQKPTTEPRKRRALLLDAHRTYNTGDPPDFDTQDVIRGLYGVSVALDEDREGEATPWLVSAARVLASLLHHAAEYESDEV